MRSRRAPGQGRLLLAAGMMVLGGFLPWVYTYVGPVSGAVGAGLWVFYAGLLAFAGGMVPAVRLRGLVVAQSVVCAVVALGLPLWQVVHLLRLLGLEGWMPGPGLVLSAFGGVLCLLAARQLSQVRPVQA
ncbi:hypothetical protein [Serinicoccus chungangensis]|uniref:hypothetical protein n=1 Tax=Serinicoccus chungangensis TaxID=767452 RepID=UPI00111934A5|nr:hypothetical protein [Serinicoccus chungangensis]